MYKIPERKVVKYKCLNFQVFIRVYFLNLFGMVFESFDTQAYKYIVMFHKMKTT